MSKQRGPIAGIAIGAALSVLGPLVGMLITAFSLNRAFDSVKGTAVTPDNKARHLAEGISGAMNSTAIGIAVGIVGIVTLLVSLVFLLLGRKQKQDGSQ